MSVESIAEEYGLKVEDLTGRSRRADVVEARYKAIYDMWKESDLPLRDIGKVFGRSIPTVCYAIQRTSNKMEEIRG